VREVLGYSAYLRLDEMKPMGERLSLRGSVESSLLCAAGEELSPVELTYSTPVSLLMETDELPDSANAFYRAMLTAAYFEPITDADGNRAISMEVRLVVQVVCSASVKGEVLSDVYSNRLICTPQMQNTALEKTERRLVLRENCRGTVKTAVPVSEVVSVRASVAGIEESAEKTVVSVRARAVFTSEDKRYCGASARLSVEFETAQEGTLSFKSERAYIAELFASPCAEGIELRIPTELEGCVISEYSVRSVSEIELSEPEENAKPKPSAVFIPCEGEYDAWELAKRYSSTRELIAQANPDFAGGMLLIPREV
jgi:hypothetical protein